MNTVSVTGSDWRVYQRQPVEIYTRTIGYIRPVSNFNLGKKSEFYSRKYFRVDEAMIKAEWNPRVQSMIESNRRFNAKYFPGNK